MFGNSPISPPGGWGSQKPPTGVVIDRAHPLAKDLTGFWGMNEGCGSSIIDASGRENTGRLVGARFAANQRGSCLAFNGSSDYVDVGTLGHFGSSIGKGVTISAWLQSSVTTSVMAVCGTARTEAGTSAIVLRLNARHDATLFTGGIRLAIADASTRFLIAGVNTNTGVTNGKPHHVCATASPLTNTINTYVDGVSRPIVYAYQQSPIAFDNFTYALSLGAFHQAGTISQFFNGHLGHVAIFSRVLSASEVAQLYREPFCMFESGGPIAALSGCRSLIDGSLASGTQLSGAVR